MAPRLLRIVVALAVSATALVACSGGGAQPQAEPTDVMDARVDVVFDHTAPTEVQVAAGESFAIRVAAEPGTGYVWDVEQAGDPAVVEHDGFLYLDEEADDPAVGGGVTVDYRFTALAPGTTTVVLQRTFQDKVEDPPVERRHEVTVTE